MKTTVTESDFRDAFRAMGRTDQFSYEGLGVLFSYLESYEQDTGEELELDVIALCCDYYEDTWESIADSYGIELTDPEDEDLAQEEVQEYLEQNTVLVGTVTGGCIYQAF
jgi:hypothetical protein